MADVVVLLEVTLLEGQKDGFLAKAEQIQSHLFRASFELNVSSPCPNRTRS